MRKKSFILQQSVSDTSGVHSTPAQRYDFGADIDIFQAGQSATVVVEATNGNGDGWQTLMTFTLDDGVEVVARSVYVERCAVRARVTASSGAPLLSVWLSEIQ